MRCFLLLYILNPSKKGHLSLSVFMEAKTGYNFKQNNATMYQLTTTIRLLEDDCLNLAY